MPINGKKIEESLSLRQTVLSQQFDTRYTRSKWVYKVVFCAPVTLEVFQQLASQKRSARALSFSRAGPHIL